MKKKNRLLMKCFLINLIIAMIAIVPFLIMEKGCFSLGTDYDNINMPLWTLCRKNIWQGNWQWSWSADLGTDFIGAFGYLALGSPFYWLTVLFPKIDYLYLGGWIYILKYAVAGLTAAIYLSRYEKKSHLIIMGSILYSFSGFQATNLMMGSFHEVVAFFPLLLVGLEDCVTEGKKGVLAATVCLNAFSNYYFFIGEVIFLILYFFIKFVADDKKYIKKIGCCLWEGTIGVLMAAVLFVPSILFVIGNPRSTARISVLSNIIPDKWTILKLWRAFFFPGEAMQNWTCVQQYDWSSCSAWLPMIGISLVICYIWGKRRQKDCLKRCILLFGIFMLLPILNSLFTLMTDVYYRWYYMPLLLFALASIRVIDKITEYPVGKVAGCMMAVMIISVGAFVWWNRYRTIIILDAKAFGFYSAIGIMGVALTGLIVLVKKETVRNYLFEIGIVSFAVMGTVLCISRYQECRNYTVESYKAKNDAIERLLSKVEQEKTPYTIQSIDNQIGAYADMPLYGSAYNSVQGSIFELWRGLGEERRVVTPAIPEGYAELVGAKYMFNSVEMDGDALIAQTKSGDKTYYLYEQETRPIGMTYAYYIIQDDFEQISTDKRIEVLKQAVVVTDKEADEIKSYMKPYSPEAQSEQTGITEFHKDKATFTCKISADEKKMCVFTIPYAKGWTAYVNGVKTNILDSSGFMAIPVEKGESRIRFTYFNKDVLWGLGLSVIGWLLFVGTLYTDRKKIERKGSIC